MENELHDRSIGLTPDSKRREKRSSILKPPKPRFPLQELSVLQAENELTATTTTGGRFSTSKRVSFAASQVKEFRADANVLTMWGSSYYEDIYKSSDSSHQTDSSNSDGHINPTEESTKYFEDSRHQPSEKECSSSEEKDLLEYTETKTSPELNLRLSNTLPSSLQKKMLRSGDDSSTNINIYSNPCSRGNISELEDEFLQVGGTRVGSHYSPQNPFRSLTSKMNTGTSSHIDRLFHEHIAAAAASDGSNDDNDDLCRPAKYFKFCAQSRSPIKLICEVDDHGSSIPNKERLRFEGKDVALPDLERESRNALHCIATSSTKEENSALSKEKKILPLHKVGSIQLSPRNVSPAASFNNSPSPTFNSPPPFPNKAFFFQKSMSPSNSASFTMSNYKSSDVSCESKIKSQTSFRHGSNINKSGHKILNVHENDNSLRDFRKGGSSHLKNVVMPSDTIGKEKPTQEAKLIKKSLTKKQDILFSNLQRNTSLEREGHAYLSSSVSKSGINSEDSYRNMELTEAPGNILHVNKSKYCNNSLTSGSISEFTETCGNILGRSQAEAGSVTSSGGHRSSAIDDRMELILCQQTQVLKATAAQKQEVQYSDSKGNNSANNSGKHTRNFDQGITSESTVDFTEAGGNIICDQVKSDAVMSLVEYPSFATKDEIKLPACQQTQELNGMFIGRREIHFSNKGNVPNENVRSHSTGCKGVLNNSDMSMELTETSTNIIDINQTKNYDKDVTPESSIEFTEAGGKIIDQNQVEVDHMSLSDENQSLSDRVNYQVLKNTSNGKQQFHVSNKRRGVSLEKSKHLLGLVNTCTDLNGSMEMTEAPGNILEINQPKNLDLSTTGNAEDFTETYRNIINRNQVDVDHLSLPKDELLGKNVVLSEQKPVKTEDSREQMVQFAQKTNIANKQAWQQHAMFPEKVNKTNGSEESMELTEASPSILVHSQTKDCDHITPDSSIELTEAYGKIIGRNETKTDHLSESADSQSTSMNSHPDLISLKQKQRIQETQYANKTRNVSIDSAGHLLVSFRNMQIFNKSERSMEVTEASGNILGSNQTKYFDYTMAGSPVDFTETFGLIFNKNRVDSKHILQDEEQSSTFDNRMILSPSQPQHILKEKTDILHAQLSNKSGSISKNARQDLSNSVGTLNCSNRRLKLTGAPGCILEVNHNITPETSIELTDAGGNIFEENEGESNQSLPRECQSSSGDRSIASQRIQPLTDDSCRKQEIFCLNKGKAKSVESTRQLRSIALFSGSDESSDLAEAPRNISDISQTKYCNQSVTPDSVMEFTKACGNILARSQLDHVPLQKENQSFSNDEKVMLHCSQLQVSVLSLSAGKEVKFSNKSKHCLVETEKSQHQSGIVENGSTFSDSEKCLELSDTPENILTANQSQNFSHSLTAENVIELTEAGGRVLERNEVEVDLTSLSAEGPSPLASNRTESTACQLNQKLMSNVEESAVSSKQRLSGSDLNITLNISDRDMNVSDTPGNIQDGNITNFNQSVSLENSMECAEAPADTSQISSRQHLSACDESMEFTTSGGEILIGSNMCVTNFDNSPLCDTRELKDDKYQQDVAGNMLNADKNLDDNQMSGVGVENVELTEGVICSPINILNHVSSGKNVSHVDVSNHHIEVTTGGSILIGKNLSVTDMDNSALCDTSELKDDKYQQEIAANSLNCDKNLDDNQISAVGAENVELTEGVICSPVNVLNHVSSGNNVGHVDVNDHYHTEDRNSPEGLDESLFVLASEKSPPSLCQIASTVIDEKVCVAEISSPAKKKIKLCEDFLEMDKSHGAAGNKSEMKDPLSNGRREPSKVSPNNANENDTVTKEVSSCSNGENYISGLSEENEFSTVTNKITVSVSPMEMVVSESNTESAILITDEIKIHDSYLIVNEAMAVSQSEEKAFCKNVNSHYFDSDKNMELTSTLSVNQVKDSCEVSVPIEDSYLKIDISIQKEDNKMELKDVSLDDETKSLCKDQVCNSLEKDGTTNGKQEGSREINSPKLEILKENGEVVDNMTSFCKERSRNSKRPEDDMSSVSKKQQACDDYSRNANPVVELPSLPKRMLSCESPKSAKRMCVNSREDALGCDQSREATSVSDDSAPAEQVLGTATADREVTSSIEQMCVTSLSQGFTSNEHSCDVNENEDPVSAKESCISSPLQDASFSLSTEEKETKNTPVPSTSVLSEHKLAEIHEEGHTSMIDDDLHLSQENQFLLCENNDASSKFVSEFFGKSYISGQVDNSENSSKMHNVEACDKTSLGDGKWLSPLNINTRPETSSCHDKVCVNENINSRRKELDTLETDVDATLISTSVDPHKSDSASYKQQVEKLEDQPSLKANSVDSEMKAHSVDGEAEEDSVEDLIRKSARRKDCIWEIRSLSTQEWSFEFLDGTLQLIINLESDNVSSIYTVSCTDEESSIMQLAHRYLQNRLTRDYLMKVCRTCSDVPNVLKLVEHSVKYSQEFVESFYDLVFTDTAETDGKSVTFDIANLEMHRWFYVSVDLSRWAGRRLHPEDISVRTIIGKIDQDEVRVLMKAVPMGPCFLRDFAKQVHWYVEECLKNLEKPWVRDTS